MHCSAQNSQKHEMIACLHGHIKLIIINFVLSNEFMDFGIYTYFNFNLFCLYLSNNAAGLFNK